MKFRFLISSLTFLALVSTVSLIAGPATSPSLLARSAVANVRGSVKLEGVVPKGKLVSMAADPSCAKLHTAPVLSQEIVADASGGLRNAIVFISEGLGDRTYTPPSKPAVIEQKRLHVPASRSGDAG